MSILDKYIGEGPKDFDFDNILPPNYVKYIEGIMKNTNIHIVTFPDSPPYYDDTYVVKFLHGVKPVDLVMQLQGDLLYPDKQHLYYNSKIFMFNMIPMGEYQKDVLVKVLFNDYFKYNLIQRFKNKGKDLVIDNIDFRESPTLIHNTL